MWLSHFLPKSHDPLLKVIYTQYMQYTKNAHHILANLKMLFVFHTQGQNLSV